MSIGCRPKWPFYSWIVILDCWDMLFIGYVSQVELHVQKRLCPIFVKNVRSPDIHECFRGLTGSQRTHGFWGVTIDCELNNMNYLKYNCGRAIGIKMDC